MNNILLCACLSKQMPDCFPRCINQHSGTGETHYLFHPFPHGRFVAVYAALLACFLFLPKRAAVQPGMRIAKQLFALGAKRDILFFFTAVKTDHQLYHSLFLINTVFAQF